MLDDIFDKLDGARVEKLIEIVTDVSFGQVIVSDTDSKRMEHLFSTLTVSNCIFEVNSNQIVSNQNDIPL